MIATLGCSHWDSGEILRKSGSVTSTKHRMDMNPSDAKLPFKMNRRQFPIIISFAMKINKSQWQSMSNVGLYLPNPVFSHGQLYVALSRVKFINGLKVLILNKEKETTNVTTNVMYIEAFQNVRDNAFWSPKIILLCAYHEIGVLIWITFYCKLRQCKTWKWIYSCLNSVYQIFWSKLISFWIVINYQLLLNYSWISSL